MNVIRNKTVTYDLIGLTQPEIKAVITALTAVHTNYRNYSAETVDGCKTVRDDLLEALADG